MTMVMRCACRIFLSSLLFVAAPSVLVAQLAIEPGDQVAVIKEGVQFGMRDQALLTIGKGTGIQVTEIRGKWIGGYLLEATDKPLGWVHHTEVRLRKLGRGAPPSDIADDPSAVTVWKDLGVRLEFDEAGRVQAIAPGGSAIQDEHLIHLRGVPNLLSLDLSGQPITDRGLANVAHCRRLQKLYLEGTRITDAGMTALIGLRRLEVLVLAKTAVTGQGASKLQASTSLQVLNMGDCPIADEDAALMADMISLEVLTLPRTKISDAGLAHFALLEKLRVLNLDGTLVKGSGFDHLRNLSELRMLYVRQCTVDSDAIDRLDDQLPGLAIYD